MLDVTSPSSLRPLSTSEDAVERRRTIADLGADDIARVVSLKRVIEPRIDHYTNRFFGRLAEIAGSSSLFSSPGALEDAKRRKREHLAALVRGQYDRSYVEQRVDLALLYSAHQIDNKAFLGAFQNMMQAIGADIIEQSPVDQKAGFAAFLSLGKVGSFDISIITDTLVAERERVISLQQDAIRELSTPVLQVRDRLLILPIIGVLDSQRAKQLTGDLLAAIRSTRSKIVVMDITGVAAVDSKVANHLIQTVAAARLMGSTVIVTGLSAEVAQALVALGIDLGQIETTSDLQAGLERAERSLGFRVVRVEDQAA